MNANVLKETNSVILIEKEIRQVDVTIIHLVIINVVLIHV